LGAVCGRGNVKEWQNVKEWWYSGAARKVVRCCDVRGRDLREEGEGEQVSVLAGKTMSAQERET